MKLKTKYFIFLLITLSSSLIIFVFFTLKIYSQDKMRFVQDKASQDIVTLARQVGEYLKVHGNGSLYSYAIRELFEKEDLSDKYLIYKDGRILISGEGLPRGKMLTDLLSEDVVQKINLLEFSTGVLDEQKGRPALLISYANVPGTHYFVIQTYQYSQLNRYLIVFLIKIFFSFLAIGSFFFLVANFTINQLTNSLDSLSTWAQKFGAGHLDASVPEAGEDEIGLLAKRFRSMAEKIRENLKLEEEKARLKMEVETAKKVQDTLFLPASYVQGSLKLAGFYEPATECGGDWWYYFAKEGTVWVCIGDVTGHGVGSAMLTSSVRSAMALIEKEQELTPGLVLTKLNDVIYETVGGKLNMTFCVMQISVEKNIFRFANASHEFPLVFPKGKDLTKNQLRFITDCNGPRLGQKPGVLYKDQEFDIQKGSRLIFFSDGVFDVLNKEQKAFGERRFIKSILKSNALAQTPERVLEGVLAELKSWRAQGDLVDDISLVCVDVD